MKPSANISALKRLNVSVQALNEPSKHEQEILKNLNKTIKGMFLEVTHKLGKDFKLNITFMEYGTEGDRFDTTELMEGTENYVKVCNSYLIIHP